MSHKIKKIMNQNQILLFEKHVNLKLKNGYHIGCCPLHGEKHASFVIYDCDRYKCFACGESGDLIDFLMKMEHKTFIEVINEYFPENTSNKSVKNQTVTDTNGFKLKPENEPYRMRSFEPPIQDNLVEKSLKTFIEIEKKDFNIYGVSYHSYLQYTDSEDAFRGIIEKTGTSISFLREIGVKPIRELTTFYSGKRNDYHPHKGDIIYRIAHKYFLYRFHKKSVKLPLFQINNYLFMVERIKNNPKIIVFVEGENDCICLNYHGNPDGLYAVTAGGVSENIKNKYQYLQSMFPDTTLVVMYDNDAAGHIGMEKCRAIGMEIFKQNIGNDVCEIFKMGKINQLIESFYHV